MNLKILTPKQSLNKAYLKEKISRTDIELFKAHFTALIDKINDKGDEEHLKSLITQFLTRTYYDQSQNQINPIGKSDLVIHTGKSPADPYGVIIEVKSPSNKPEMISAGKANVKAFHELVLYYLDERVGRNRNELKQLIITNIYDWYIIDANEFDKKIYRNTAIKKLYDLKKSDNKDNPWFYDELKKLFDNHAELSIDATFFDLRDFKKIITNAARQDDKGLISLYKILSPVHLLKLPFANDSNTLQPKFYSELLHLIGLYEYKEGSKKLISRKKDGERNAGSLLENAIVQLESHDKISRLDKPSQYGDNYNDRIYAVALELVITWINRILFLKLLEAQLINYHKGDRSYTFLDKEKIKDFDDLDKLFFRVLAKRSDERSADVQKLFNKVPYLNSSLFEPTELEHQTLFINNIENNVKLPVLSATVLKDANGKTLKGSLDTLDYLFAFLNAYDFSSEGAEEIQEDNKQLINASVLGLIFEKINGYKDGSFFTPGFITMYMCRETIRRAVVQKFNETKGWNCKEYNELFDRIKDKKEANGIINSLKICDPAVGSGHFLVSALNEMIAIKSDLQMLLYRDGRTMRDYGITVENDELIVTDDNGDIFEYHSNNAESQRVQEALFHEKQTIIEGCLFGVDINPNSVKICRLRLWIELLKNAYYKPDTTELETLPNIDINIKIGNSLISHFALDADLKQALKKSKYSIDGYKIAVQTYREAKNKEEKREMERLIATIKSDFRTEISANDPKIKALDKKSNELYNKYQTGKLFAEKLTPAQIKDRKKLEDEVNKLGAEIADIKTNKIYENAFEWRFEFPEVLNDDGEFVGFDVVIGNPPYGVQFNHSEKQLLERDYFAKDDIYTIFLEKANKLSNTSGFAALIIPIFWLTGDKYYPTRKFILTKAHIEIGIILPYNIFADAYVDTGIYIFSKNTSSKITHIYEFDPKEKIDIRTLTLLNLHTLYKNEWADGPELKIIFNNLTRSLTNKFNQFKISIGHVTNSVRGILADEEDYSESQQHDGYKKIFVGKIDRYKIEGNKFEFLKYGDNLKEKPNSYEYFKGERLLIRRIINRQFRIMATIVNEEFVTKKDVYTFKLNRNDFSYKYILAIINSKLISFIKTKASTSAKKDDFTQLTLNDIREITLPISDAEQIQLIESNVENILSLNKDDVVAIRTLEKEIDQLVYQLYGLTEEEIKIVEGI